MKKILITALGASLLVTGTSSMYAISDTTDYTEKKVYEQSKSSQMRMEYYNKYKAKGYDVSSLDSYLDATKTSESEFWEALKQVQNNHELPGRREYVNKLQSKGYDVSGFTDAVILDSGKFWEMVKSVEAGKQGTVELKKEEVKKYVETKKEEIPKKVEVKKEEIKTKVEEKKMQGVTKASQTQTDRLTKLMRERIAKIPAENRDATLVRLETALKSGIETARAKNAKILVTRYETLLAVVQEEMNNIDDETLINSLFQ